LAVEVNWLNLKTSVKTAPEFVGCDPVHRATWLCLMLYCAEQENGGVILGCGSWGNRRWMQTCGVTKDEILDPCDLWQIEGGDLRLWGYPVEREAQVRAERDGGRRGGKISGFMRRKTKQIEPSPEPLSEPPLQAPLQASPERKGKEGKGKEEHTACVPTGAREERNSYADSFLPPSIDAVLAEAVVVGMSEQDAREFHEFWTAAEWRDKAGLRVRWKPALVSRKNVLANERAKCAGGSNGRKVGGGRSAATRYQAPGRPYDGAF